MVFCRKDAINFLIAFLSHPDDLALGESGRGVGLALITVCTNKIGGCGIWWFWVRDCDYGIGKFCPAIPIWQVI